MEPTAQSSPIIIYDDEEVIEITSDLHQLKTLIDATLLIIKSKNQVDFGNKQSNAKAKLEVCTSISNTLDFMENFFDNLA